MLTRQELQLIYDALDNSDHPHYGYTNEQGMAMDLIERELKRIEDDHDERLLKAYMLEAGDITIEQARQAVRQDACPLAMCQDGRECDEQYPCWLDDMRLALEAHDE